MQSVDVDLGPTQVATRRKEKNKKCSPSLLTTGSDGGATRGHDQPPRDDRFTAGTDDQTTLVHPQPSVPPDRKQIVRRGRGQDQIKICWKKKQQKAKKMEKHSVHLYKTAPHRRKKKQRGDSPVAFAFVLFTCSALPVKEAQLAWTDKSGVAQGLTMMEPCVEHEGPS